MDPAAGPTHINPPPFIRQQLIYQTKYIGARCCFTNRDNCCPDMKRIFLFNFQKFNKKVIIGKNGKASLLQGSNMTIYQNFKY